MTRFYHFADLSKTKNLPCEEVNGEWKGIIYKMNLPTGVEAGRFGRYIKSWQANQLPRAYTVGNLRFIIFLYSFKSSFEKP